MAYSYARRTEIARDKGFDSYGEYRRAMEFANRGPEFQRHMRGQRAGGHEGKLVDEAKLYYQAFKKGAKDDYSVKRNKAGDLVVRTKDGKPTGAKAKWLIDIAGYVDDVSEWKRRYPKGHRGRE